MSLFTRLFNLSRQSRDYMRAEGVLPVERVLADEHEALHGESLDAALEKVSATFDAAQFTDVREIARNLRAAERARTALDDAQMDPVAIAALQLTPRDGVCQFLLLDAALRSALDEYQREGEPPHGPAADAFAAALAVAFNKRLDDRLMDEPAFRPFEDTGMPDALGDRPAGATNAAADAHFLRLTNRELLESVFPRDIARLRDRRLAVVFDAARRRDNSALCLSGGGIRSSTFALGVMQGLARHGLLGEFDYLSTVSGGGLSGGWLTSWMHREGADTVHDHLREQGREKLQPEPDPVQGLRAFSRWLVPRAGAMSVDKWTVIATVMRNLLLNWLVLLPLLASAVLLPRLLLSFLEMDYDSVGSFIQDHSDNVVRAGLLAGIALLIVSGVFVEWVRAAGDEFADAKHTAPAQTGVMLLFLVPNALGSVILTLVIWVGFQWETDPDVYAAMAAWGVVIALIAVPITALMRRGRRTRRSELARAMKALLSGVIGYAIAVGLVLTMNTWEDELQRDMYMTLGPVVMMLGSVITSQIYSGITSNEAGDAEREWAARANAWVLIICVAWMAGSGVVLLGPSFAEGVWRKVSLMGVGGLASWLTVRLGKRAAPAENSERSASAATRRIALSLAAPAVIVCLVIGLAMTNEENLKLACTGRAISAKLKCKTDAADAATTTPAAPMLAILANAKLGQVSEASHELWRALAAGGASIPTASGDTDIIGASHRATLAFLSFDSLERRRVRGSGGDFSKEYNVVRAQLDTLSWNMDAFTDARNASVHGIDSLEGANLKDKLKALHLADSVVDAELAARVVSDTTLSKAQRVLATRSALVADRRIRTGDTTAVHETADSVRLARGSERPGENAMWIGVLALLVVMLGGSALASLIVNTNTFSLHAMWKARTVRAFLGTTRPAAARAPNPFTGFDSADDIPLRELWPARSSAALRMHRGRHPDDTPPMHVFNVTLNVATGAKLAWQQRKGESMTLTSLHAGSAFTGYRRMNPGAANPALAGADGYGGRRGVTLGTAMAISGAAASPSDGANTTPVGSFLLTLFNARLGWWLGNPGAHGAATWQRSAPVSSLTPILSEMFGLTSDKSPYVYLSDGGHFENLGLYEMVLRRCRFIVVCDAGADSEYGFEDLGNAVRKCRIDFGIPIKFEQPIQIGKRDAAGRAYWATARIGYSHVDMPAGGKRDDYDGVLVYIKPAIYGTKEPRDVVNYANQSPAFPQESSADQFFTESQFESYRALGAWIIDELVADAAAGGKPVVVAKQRDGSLVSRWPNLRGSAEEEA